MTEREALKLTLAALKQIDEAMPFPVAKLAIMEAEKALAQPEQEPVIGTKTWFEDGKIVTQHLTAKDIYKEPEQIPPSAYSNTHQPEQEPVAWAQFSEAGNLIDLLEEPCGGYVPLYTTPPQRKPLTDEEIDEIYFKSSLEVDSRCEDIYDFARAIEAAHGIKE